MTLPLRNVSSNKSASPTAKLRNKLNFKKSNKSGSQSTDSSPLKRLASDKMDERLIDKLNDKFANKLADKLSNKLNDKMANLTDNVNIVNHNRVLTHSKSFAYTSLSTISDWNRPAKGGQINRIPSHLGCFNEYDRVGPPVLAKSRIN